MPTFQKPVFRETEDGRGVWECEVSQETYDRLTRLQQPGESAEDVLKRALDAFESGSTPQS